MKYNKMQEKKRTRGRGKKNERRTIKKRAIQGERERNRGKEREHQNRRVPTKEWRMRAVVVLPADRFSTTHHGKTVDDGTFTFFAFLSFSSIFSFSLFFFYSTRWNDE